MINQFMMLLFGMGMGMGMPCFCPQVVFYVFNPALVSSNLAETITYDNMVKMYHFPPSLCL